MVRMANLYMSQSLPRKEDYNMAKTIKIGRDAGSGKFIPVKEAIKRPKTTVIETIKKK
jgi:hypothetical protein